MAIKKISIDDLDNFAIEEHTNKLYWNGQRVVTQMSLPWWVQASAIVTAVSAGVVAFIEALRFFGG